METGYIDFRADVGKWKAAHKLDVGNDLTTLNEAFVITQATEGVDATVDECLRTILDMNALDAELKPGFSEKNFAGALTILSSRKFSKTLATLTEKPEWQAKEKKMVQELLRLYATRKLARHFGMELNYAKPAAALLANGVALKEGTIQFIANYPGWKCVKKFKVESTTNRRTVAEFMTSYTITMDLRFEQYLRTILDIAALESVLKDAPKKGATMNEALNFLASPAVVNVIQKIAGKVPAGKGVDAATILRTFAVRKILKENGYFVEYAQIKSLPGWKRVIGKRK